jgi:hypothetical protein
LTSGAFTSGALRSDVSTPSISSRTWTIRPLRLSSVASRAVATTTKKIRARTERIAPIKPVTRPRWARPRWESALPRSTLRIPIVPSTTAVTAQGRETKKAAPELNSSRRIESGPRKTATSAGTFPRSVG